MIIGLLFTYRRLKVFFCGKTNDKYEVEQLWTLKIVIIAGKHLV